MNTPRTISPLGDEAIAYAAFAWNCIPSEAHVIISNAVNTGKLQESLSFEEFNQYVQNILHPTPPPKKTIPILLIVSYLFGCFGLLVIYGMVKDLVITPALYQSTYSTPRPTATSYRPATVTPARISATSAPSSTCLLWSDVTPNMAGQEVCVYGTVINYQENSALKSTYLYFGSPDQFFLVITDFVFTDFKDNDCALAHGTVQLNTYKTPYIKITDLYFCEPWME